MQVKFTRKGATLIVKIIGELDHHSADYLRQKVDGELIKPSTRNVIFDFSSVSFMDSSGIGVIMGRLKTIQKLNGKIAIVNTRPQIKRIFEMSGLLKIVPACESIESAIGMM